MSEQPGDLYASAADRTGRQRAESRWGLLGLVLLLASYAGLALSSAAGKSVTVDELGHLPSGVYFLTTGDPRYASLNPPLANALSALPVLFLELSNPLVAPPATDDVLSFWSTGYHFLEQQRADYLRIYAVARCVPVLLVAGLGALLFVWARRLVPAAPNAAGLLAAGFVCGSPNVLAQARIVGTDTGAALFVALALFAFRAMLLRPTVVLTLVCALMLGLAQLTKLYALLLYPCLALVTVGWHALSVAPRPRLARLIGCYGAAVVGSLVVLNTGYLWQEFGISLAELPIESSALKVWQQSALGALPLPLPAAYLRGVDGQLVEVGSGIWSFLFGETFQGGRWYYYLALLAIKTPPPLLLAFALAVTLSLMGSKLPRRERLLLLAYPVLLFVLLSFSARRQLGSRALLVAVPLVQLWVAATLAGSARLRWTRPAAAALLAGTLVISVWTHPNYLSYFNLFVGGSDNGYRYASDANVDIGQDLPQLAEYLDEHLEATGAERVQLVYFGSVDPELYGIDYEVPTDALSPGLLAVSVSLYRMAYLVFDHRELRQMGPVIIEGLGDPVASIGGSIHVYRVEP
jgi:hypothetical protein